MASVWWRARPPPDGDGNLERAWTAPRKALKQAGSASPSAKPPLWPRQASAPQNPSSPPKNAPQPPDQPDGKYSQQLATTRLEVPFFVKSVPDFEAKYGRPGSHSRGVLERQVGGRRGVRPRRGRGLSPAAGRGGCRGLMSLWDSGGRARSRPLPRTARHGSTRFRVFPSWPHPKTPSSALNAQGFLKPRSRKTLV